MTINVDGGKSEMLGLREVFFLANMELFEDTGHIQVRQQVYRLTIFCVVDDVETCIYKHR